MNKVFKVFTIAGLAAVLSAGIFAQGAGPKGGIQDKGKQGAGKGQGRGGFGMMRGKGMQEVYAKLDLTADQKKKLEALQKSTQDKMKAAGIGGKQQKPNDARGQKMGDQKAMMDKIKPIIEAHQKGIKDILTDAQEKKLDTLMQEMREKRRKERGGNGGPGGAAGKGNKANKGGTGGGTAKGGGGL